MKETQFSRTCMSSHVALQKPGSGEYLAANVTSVLDFNMTIHVSFEGRKYCENPIANFALVNLVTVCVLCKCVGFHLKDAQVKI